MWTIMVSIFCLIMMIYLTPMHPMKMTLMLLMFSLTLVFNMSIISSSMIYSYMMFLIMIGGVIIMILYFTSLIIYKKYFSMKKYLNFVYMMFIFMLMIIFYIWMMKYPEILNFFYKNNLNLMLINTNKIFNMENFMLSNNLFMLYSYYLMPMILFCITTLLLILYFIAKITLKLSKPLRLMQN